MSNKITLKKSSVSGKVPLPEDLAYGELALNYTDGNLFYKDSANTITTIASNQFLSVTGNVTGNYIIGDGSQLTNLNAFTTVTAPLQSNVVANTSGTINFEGSGISITTNPSTGTVTFTNTSAASIFGSGGDMGLIVDPVTSSEDLGLITELFTNSYDLGTVTTGGLVWPEQLRLPPYEVMSLPDASIPGCMIFVTDAAGGPIPAFSDGTYWRRVDDQNIVT